MWRSMRNWFKALGGSWLLGCGHPAPTRIEAPPPPLPIEEVWSGQVQIREGLPLEFTVAFRTEVDGTASAVMSIPAQGVERSPLAEVERSSDRLRFTLPMDAHEARWAYFDAQREPHATQAYGTLSQAGQTFPLTMERQTRGQLRGLSRRPQTPQLPVPYLVEELSFTHEGVQLAGTLTLPPSAGPHPGIVLIQGSGPLDRDASLYGHRPFWVVADHLTRQGFAVLRVDARGVGHSEGDFAHATLDTRAGDIAAALETLRLDPRINASRLGLLGHSEGGLVAGLTTHRDPRVAFLVLLAVPGLPGSSVAMLHLERVLQDFELGSEPTRRRLELQRTLLDGLHHTDDPAYLHQVLEPHLGALSETEQAQVRASLEPQLPLLTSPWYRSLIRVDPKPIFSELDTNIPILVLFGERDVQVLPEDNILALQSALSEHRDATFRSLPELNHLFQTAPTGSPSEYANLEQTFSPDALELISEWLQRDP